MNSITVFRGVFAGALLLGAFEAAAAGPPMACITGEEYAAKKDSLPVIFRQLPLYLGTNEFMTTAAVKITTTGKRLFLEGAVSMPFGVKTISREISKVCARGNQVTIEFAKAANEKAPVTFTATTTPSTVALSTPSGSIELAKITAAAHDALAGKLKVSNVAGGANGRN